IIRIERRNHDAAAGMGIETAPQGQTDVSGRPSRATEEIEVSLTLLLTRSQRNRRAELLGRIARDRNSLFRECQLRERRAVEAGRSPATPEIRRSEQLADAPDEIELGAFAGPDR